ncbi:LegC family aminotransferase [Pontimonas sp.]|nr:LegC family aminotransferase [Pontimonas sp.]MDA8900960.1 LegC family aminotransferase [Pontimonas sp.]
MSLDEISESPSGRLVAQLGELVGNSAGGLHEPLFEGNEKSYVAECIETAYVSSVGSFVARFENDLAQYVGAPHAIAVVNGTSALHLALVGVGVTPGCEVIVPALSFVATASAVVLAGAVPHFVDVCSETWGIDPAALREHLRLVLRRDSGGYVNKETGRPVTAIVPMHTLGHPFDATAIKAVAEEFELVVVEDAAESLGSFSGGIHTGLAGRVGTFSFNGNKTITTGGGGALVTSDPDLAARLKHLSTTAKSPHRFEFDHDAVGYNYRMPNLNAALGVAQLEQLPFLLERQRSLYRKYCETLNGLGLGTVRTEIAGTKSNYWLQAFLLDKEHAPERDRILHACLDSGISVRPLWKPLTSLAPYRQSPRAPTPVAEDLYSRVICLPSSAALGR